MVTRIDQYLLKLIPVMDELNYSSTFKENIIKSVHQPRCAQLEITSKCNASCIICPREGMSRPIVDMDESLFKKCVDSVSGGYLVDLGLHLAGEPLMFPIDKLVELINYAKVKLNNTLISFFTNASLLTEEKSRKLIYNSELDVLNFSVDGGTKETYEKVRVGLNFDVVVNNIMVFVRINKENDGRIKTHTNIVPLMENRSSFESYYSLFHDIGVDSVGGSGVNNIGGFIDANSMRTPEQGIPKPNQAPCHRIFQHLNVLADGRVCICCLDFRGEHIIGDMNKEENLLDVWFSDYLFDVRVKHLKKQRNTVPYCTNCDYLDTLGMPEWWPK